MSRGNHCNSDAAEVTCCKTQVCWHCLHFCCLSFGYCLSLKLACPGETLSLGTGKGGNAKRDATVKTALMVTAPLQLHGSTDAAAEQLCQKW